MVVPVQPRVTQSPRFSAVRVDSVQPTELGETVTFHITDQDVDRFRPISTVFRDPQTRDEHNWWTAVPGKNDDTVVIQHYLQGNGPGVSDTHFATFERVGPYPHNLKGWVETVFTHSKSLLTLGTELVAQAQRNSSPDHQSALSRLAASLVQEGERHPPL